MKRLGLIVIIVIVFVLGIAAGAYLFKDTRARSFTALPQCGSCLTKSEFAGLLASAGIQKASGALPFVLAETDKSIAFESPIPEARIDYVVLPKKDIKDLGDLSADDRAYIADGFEVVASLIRDHHLQNYRVYTNGPGYQKVNYLHFHLLAK
jgi:histidine triad (HIT) family protein